MEMQEEDVQEPGLGSLRQAPSVGTRGLMRARHPPVFQLLGPIPVAASLSTVASLLAFALLFPLSNSLCWSQVETLKRENAVSPDAHCHPYQTKF